MPARTFLTMCDMIPLVDQMIDDYTRTCDNLRDKIGEMELDPQGYLLAQELQDEVQETLDDLHALKKEVKRYGNDNDSR